MRKEQIIRFCRHVRQRQEKHGVTDAFRFLMYQNGKERAAADYGVRVDEERAAVRALNQQQARQEKKQEAKRKGKQKATDGEPARPNPNPNPNERPNSHPNLYSNPIPDPTVGASGSQSQLHHIEISRDRQFAIDPVLLNDGGEQSGTNVPRLHEPGILINNIEMQRLHALGYPLTIPVNGPSEGLPMYCIPASARDRLDDQTGNGVGHQTEVARPAKTPRKKTRTTDARTIEEGQKLLRKEHGKDPGESRRATRRR